MRVDTNPLGILTTLDVRSGLGALTTESVLPFISTLIVLGTKLFVPSRAAAAFFGLCHRLVDDGKAGVYDLCTRIYWHMTQTTGGSVRQRGSTQLDKKSWSKQSKTESQQTKHVETYGIPY